MAKLTDLSVGHAYAPSNYFEILEWAQEQNAILVALMISGGITFIMSR